MILEHRVFLRHVYGQGFDILLENKVSTGSITRVLDEEGLIMLGIMLRSATGLEATLFDPIDGKTPIPIKIKFTVIKKNK